MFAAILDECPSIKSGVVRTAGPTAAPGHSYPSDWTAHNYFAGRISRSSSTVPVLVPDTSCHPDPARLRRRIDHAEARVTPEAVVVTVYLRAAPRPPRRSRERESCLGLNR